MNEDEFVARLRMDTTTVADNLEYVADLWVGAGARKTATRLRRASNAVRAAATDAPEEKG